jgi:cyclic beta-1,2-glucan synthetase
MTVRYRTARYEIEVENPDGAGGGIATAELDGAPVDVRPLRVLLTDDGLTHRLRVRLG